MGGVYYVDVAKLAGEKPEMGRKGFMTWFSHITLYTSFNTCVSTILLSRKA